jgi:hypothetical protein
MVAGRYHQDKRLSPMPSPDEFWKSLEAWKLRKARIEIACRQQPIDKRVEATVISIIGSKVTFRDIQIDEEYPLDFAEGPYREGFIDYCKAHNVPLDFYSWHNYTDYSADLYDAIRISKDIRKILDTHGFPKTESVLSEWNISADFTDAEKPILQGAEEAAYVGAELSYAQDAPIDHAHFYRGDAAWMGLFDIKGQYFKSAYTFKAMGKMLDSPQRLAAKGADTFGFAALAVRSADSKLIQILISNYAIPQGYQPHKLEMPPELLKSAVGMPDFSKIKPLPLRTDIVYRNNAGYNLTIDHLPWGENKFTVKRWRINEAQNFDLVDEKSATGPSLRISAPLAPFGVELIALDAH